MAFDSTWRVGCNSRLDDDGDDDDDSDADIRGRGDHSRFSVSIFIITGFTTCVNGTVRLLSLNHQSLIYRCSVVVPCQEEGASLESHYVPYRHCLPHCTLIIKTQAIASLVLLN